MTLHNLAKMSRAAQDPFELWQLLVQISFTRPKRILEIGVESGGFAETIRKAFPDALMIGIDKNFSKLEFTDFSALAGDSHLPSMREAVMELCKFHPLDVLFIDGDHSYEGVKADYELYQGLVRPGGLIAFHDTNSNGTHNTKPGQRQVRDFMVELDRSMSFKRLDFLGHAEAPGTRVIWV